MTFCVLFDTSHTMSEQCSGANSMSKMDIGKCVAESLLLSVRKSRAPSNPHMVQLPLMVLTPGDDYNCIVSSLGDPPHIADSLMKNITCSIDVTKESNISFPISQAITMTNKYRMTNNIDTFGFGRYPIAREPLKIFVITDGVNIMQSEQIVQMFSSSAVSTGVDFAEPCRWEQQFYVILVKKDIRCRLPGNLIKLCEDSCGGVVEISDIEGIKARVNGLVSKVTVSSVGVVIHDERDSKIVSARLVVVKETAEWPVPESYVYKKTLNKLPRRKPYPDLCILSDQTINYAQMLENTDIPFDSYELTSSLPSAAFCTLFSLNQSSSYAVSVICTGDDDTSTRGFTKRTEKHSLQTPFGVLKYKKETGNLMLTVLPYNFPVLLPILRQGLMRVKTGTNTSAWAQTWCKEFDNYLNSVPPNYHQSIMNLLKGIDLKPIYHQGSLLSAEFAFSSVVAKKLETSHSVAKNDVIAMEMACRDRWIHTVKPHLEDLILRENRRNFPTSAFDVKTSNLLSEWETMRCNIFGGPVALTLRGLAVSNVQGSGGWMANVNVSDNGLFSQACGGSYVPSMTMTDAGDYQTILASRECLRDPTLLVVPDDEDAPIGVMRRKFDVNFGSKFKKTKGVSDERETTHEELFVDSPFPSPKRLSNQSERSKSRAKKSPLTLELIPKKKSKPNNSPSFGYNDDTMTSGECSPVDRESLGPVVDATDVAASEPNLPAGWKKLYSQRENRHYYFNKESGKSSWILSSITEAPAEASPAPALDDSNLPVGWKKCFSKRENRVYYFHAASKQSSWVVPTT